LCLSVKCCANSFVNSSIADLPTGTEVLMYISHFTHRPEALSPQSSSTVTVLLSIRSDAMTRTIS
jgi:hypothetical protein